MKYCNRQRMLVELPERACVVCGTRFHPWRPHHKFCSEECRQWVYLPSREEVARRRRLGLPDRGKRLLEAMARGEASSPGAGQDIEKIIYN